MIPGPVLSAHEIAPLLHARQAGAATARISPDLGLTTVTVALDAMGARFPDGAALGWADLERMAAAPNKCFLIVDDTPRDIQVFSETTHWVRTLLPTTGAPTTVVGGFPMHRIKGIDPWQDTVQKVQTIAPLVGQVLDTATGLGYTAIVAAQTAAQVVTIELDPAALEIARLNPWSQALFDNPRIVQIVGDATAVLPTLEPGRFARVLHDPPVFSLGGELYSGAFYRELYRVLTRNGRLFHYIGDLTSRSGQTVSKGVVRRLHEAGFARVQPRPAAFGVVAYK
jgi:predicted methyltransferase